MCSCALVICVSREKCDRAFSLSRAQVLKKSSSRVSDGTAEVRAVSPALVTPKTLSLLWQPAAVGIGAQSTAKKRPAAARERTSQQAPELLILTAVLGSTAPCGVVRSPHNVAAGVVAFRCSASCLPCRRRQALDFEEQRPKVKVVKAVCGKNSGLL